MLHFTYFFLLFQKGLFHLLLHFLYFLKNIINWIKNIKNLQTSVMHALVDRNIGKYSLLHVAIIRALEFLPVFYFLTTKIIPIPLAPLALPLVLSNLNGLFEHFESYCCQCNEWREKTIKLLSVSFLSRPNKALQNRMLYLLLNFFIWLLIF